MSTLKPNKLDQVKSQLKEQEIPNKLFPKEIKESERHLFHVIIVESIADPVKKKFNFKVHHKKYNEKSFAVNKTQLAKLGYADAHIIHDPTIEDFNEDKGNDLSEKLKSLEQKEKDLKAREEALAKKEAKLNTKGSQDTPPPPLTIVKGDPSFDVEKAKGDELKAFAEANSIDLKDAKKVDEIRAVITQWLDEVREKEQAK